MNKQKATILGAVSSIVLSCLLLSRVALAKAEPVAELPSDPTKPDVIKTSTGLLDQVVDMVDEISGFQLQAILISDGQKRAVISGRLVNQGDELDSKTQVLLIEQNRVEISRDGEVIELTMRTPNVKQLSEQKSN